VARTTTVMPSSKQTSQRARILPQGSPSSRRTYRGPQCSVLTGLQSCCAIASAATARRHQASPSTKRQRLGHGGFAAGNPTKPPSSSSPIAPSGPQHQQQHLQGWSQEKAARAPRNPAYEQVQATAFSACCTDEGPADPICLPVVR
jgi:hypothetical protein